MSGLKLAALCPVVAPAAQWTCVGHHAKTHQATRGHVNMEWDLKNF